MDIYLAKLAPYLISLPLQTDIFLVDAQSPIENLAADLSADCLLLSGALDQYRAEALKEQLLGAVTVTGEKPRPVVDMTAVDHIDASCLQVLLACKPLQQDKLVIKGAVPSVRQWIRIAGADELFDFVGEND